MTIARIISIGIVVMFVSAIGIARYHPIYAATPCCTFQNGVWIFNKTGKPATAAQIRTMEYLKPAASTDHLHAPAEAGRWWSDWDRQQQRRP